MAVELSEFRRTLWRLDADHREVLMLIGATGLSYEEAAEVCNCATGTIKSRLSRARRELARLLAEGANFSYEDPLRSRRGPNCADHIVFGSCSRSCFRGQSAFPQPMSLTTTSR